MAAGTTNPGGAAISMLDGVPARIRGRHAFVHERLLILVARETERHGGLRYGKQEASQLLGCNQRSVDRAMTRLRRDGLIRSIPQFNERGGQIANEYRATALGMQQARALCERA